MELESRRFMKKRSAGKGGRRKSARKAQRAVRSKPNVLPASSVPPRAAEWKVIEELTLNRQDLLFALRDAIFFYNRAAGTVRNDQGWTAADISRLKEIRDMAFPVYVRAVI
jgi:hypothetical protein